MDRNKGVLQQLLNKIPGNMSKNEVNSMRLGEILFNLEKQDPMMGESFEQMYNRLKSEMGGEPFMPSYAYNALDEDVKSTKANIKYFKAIKNKESQNEFEKRLKRLQGYR